MLYESIFMIRGGSFGFDFNIKLILSIIGLFACVYDWRAHHRKDYFWVFLVGTILDAGSEVIIQLTGNRVMGNKYLLGIVIPLWFSIPIQGMAEGGFAAIVGIFFGDFLMDPRTRKRGAIALVVAIVLEIIPTLATGLPARNVGGDVPSRRDMLAPATLAVMIALIIVNVIWFWKRHGAVRKRGAYMLLVLLVFFTAWTIGEWFANTRWIEVGTLGGSLVLADPLVQFLALAWDVVVEIAFALTPAFFIPYELGRIKKDNHRRETKKERLRRNAGEPSEQENIHAIGTIT